MTATRARRPAAASAARRPAAVRRRSAPAPAAGTAARAADLVRSLRAFRGPRGARVTSFRLNYGEGRTATLGIYDSRVGSVYSPFQISEGARGSFVVEWQDGLVSRGTIDGNTGGDLGPALRAAWDARYRDDEARAFAGKSRIPSFAIHDPAIERIVGGRFGLLYDIVDLIRARGDALKVKKVSGSVMATVGTSTITTSRGLAYAGTSTEFSYGFSFDAELGDGRSRRRPPSLAQVAAVIDRAALLLPSLRTRDVELASGERKALLLPHFAAELVDSYVISNLYGAEVSTGQSAFKPEDFQARRRFFREDLRITVDPSVPFSSGSYNVTSEGLPARRETYVDRGSLLRPIVGMKYARRLGVKPTTPPTSMESIVLEAAGSTPLAYPRALRALGDGGIVVLSALGVHTQDTTLGDFSLTAPQAIVVRGGRMVGARKVVIAGNFFEALRSPATHLVRVPGDRFPGLLIDAHVTVG